MLVFDENGDRMEWGPLAEQFGNVLPVGVEGIGYQPIALQIATGGQLEVMVVDAEGNPMPGVMVARAWEDAGLPELPEKFLGMRRTGLHTTTDEEGVATLAYNRSDHYDPKHAPGASIVWCEGASGAISGLGLLTNGNHLNVVFAYQSSSSPAELVKRAAGHLRRAQEALNELLEEIG